MGILELGPLTIKYEWLILFLAGIMTFILLRILLRQQPFKQQFIDALLNGVVIWFLIYKFSILLFRPSLLFENPLGILYFHGGMKGSFLGAFIAFLYLIWRKRKSQWGLREFIHGFTYSIVGFGLSYWLIRTCFLLFIVP